MEEEVDPKSPKFYDLAGIKDYTSLDWIIKKYAITNITSPRALSYLRKESKKGTSLYDLRKMKLGDRCFFYHTGKIKSIVGIVKVKKEAFLDKSDKTKKFVSIVIQALYPLKREVSLHEIKKNKDFKDFPLVKQSRLSVVKVDLKYWKKICKMGKVPN